MSVTKETLEYYRGPSATPTEELETLFAPFVLLESTDTDGISIRDIHDTFTSGSGRKTDALQPLEQKAQAYVQKMAEPILTRIRVRAPMDFVNTQTESLPDFSLHGTNLISPKVVTGKLTELAIQPVAPTELPFTFSARQEKHPLLANEAAYFMLSGTVLLGGRKGSIAAGMRVTPALTHWDRVLTLKANLRRFSDAQASAVQVWTNSIAATRNRQASAMRHPFSGGLPSLGKG